MTLTATLAVVLPAAPVAERRPTDPDRTVTFALRADAEPGLLPRALELVAKRGLVPVSLRSDLAADGESLSVDIAVRGLARAESDHIANCLRTIPGVTQVLVAERRLEAVA